MSTTMAGDMPENMSIKQLTLMPVKLVRTHFLLFSVAIVLTLGWMRRGDNYLTAENGTGYILGILGGSLMLVLLLYPLSKRIRLLTRWIPIRYWFGIHMAFGVLGPAMVLLHSNFKLGSINSSIALFSMLLVAGSGLIGRYIYTNIHHGLYGVRITLKELKTDTATSHMELINRYTDERSSAALNERLNAMEQKALQPCTNLITNLAHVIELAINAKKLKRQVIKLIDKSLNNNGMENSDDKLLSDRRSVVISVDQYTLALRRAAAFKLYERLFSLWHILHLPLFIMMIITAVVHIFAVHMY